MDLNSTRAYLRSRAERESFAMVEIGPRACPVVHQQPWDWQTDVFTYIAVEAHLRDPYGRAKEALQTELNKTGLLGSAVQLVEIDTGVHSVYDESTGLSFSGEYSCQLPLLDQSVDEVFASNVFGDGAVACSAGAPEILADEISRILRPDGTLVIRETVTPINAVSCLKRVAGNRLHEVSRVEPNDIATWHELEQVFGTNEMLFDPGYQAFYSFLRHI